MWMCYLFIVKFLEGVADSKSGTEKVQGELETSCTRNHGKKTGTALKGLPLAKFGVICIKNTLWIIDYWL